MGDLLKQLGGLLAASVSSDVTPEERKGARGFLVKVGWRVVVIVCLMWSFGMLTFTGMGSGFARATDLPAKIEEATKPIKQQIGEQQRLLERLSNQVTQSLAEGKAGELRFLRSKWCKESDAAEISRLSTELDRKEKEYRNLTDETYVTTCASVR